MIEVIIRYGLEIIGFCVLFTLFKNQIIPRMVTLLGLQMTPEEIREAVEHKRAKLIIAGILGLSISAFVSFAIIYYIDKFVR